MGDELRLNADSNETESCAPESVTGEKAMEDLESKIEQEIHNISIGTLNLIEVTLMEDLLSNSIKDPDLSLFQGSASSSMLEELLIEESIDDFNSFSAEKNLSQLQSSQIPMESTEKQNDSYEPIEIVVNKNEDRNPRKKPMLSSVSDILPFKRRSQRIQKQRATVPIESNIKSTNESKKKKLSNQMMSFRGKALKRKKKRGR